MSSEICVKFLLQQNIERPSALSTTHLKATFCNRTNAYMPAIVIMHRLKYETTFLLQISKS